MKKSYNVYLENVTMYAKKCSKHVLYKKMYITYLKNVLCGSENVSHVH